MDRKSEATQIVEKVREGAVVMRIENESQASLALQKPRDVATAVSKAIAEMVAFPEMASSAYYSIPYAEKKGSDRKIFVEGLSINGALSLGRYWGNCATACRFVDETEDKVMVEGVFLDYETNFRVMRQVTVSKIKRYQTGQTYWLSDDKLSQAIGAGMSKAQRNAILAGIPDLIKQKYFLKAKELTAKQIKKVPKQGEKAPLQELLENLAGYGVTEEMLEGYFGKAKAEYGEDERLKMQGILNALRDKITTVDSIFNETEEGDPFDEKKDEGADDGVIPEIGKEKVAGEKELKEKARELLLKASEVLGRKFNAWRAGLMSEFGASDLDDISLEGLKGFIAKAEKQLGYFQKQ